MRPIWKEGLFMMPQHLQMLEQHQDQLIDQRFRLVMGHDWGLGELEINEDELSRGIFQIARCTAVMPDGLLVRVGPDQQTKACMVMAAGRVPAGGQAVEVCLAVPGDGGRGTNTYVSSDASSAARYLHVTQPTNDAYGSADTTDVECIEPNVKLVLGANNAVNQVLITVAKLQLAENGTLQVSSNYIPPCLQIRASRYLMDSLTELVNVLSAKQHTLSQQYKSRTQSLVEFGAADMLTFSFLQILNASIPQLSHYASTGRIHPEELYLALSSLTNQLVPFDVTIDLPQLPRYNHSDLAGTFLPLLALLRGILLRALAPRFTAISLNQPQPGLFVGQIEDAAVFRKMQFFLVAGGDVAQSKLREEVPRYVKISALGQIANVVQAAITGIEAKIDLTPPPSLPLKADNVYLRLEQQGTYWDEVVRTSTIAIYQPIEPQQVKLELLAVEM